MEAAITLVLAIQPSRLGLIENQYEGLILRGYRMPMVRPGPKLVQYRYC